MKRSKVRIIAENKMVIRNTGYRPKTTTNTRWLLWLRADEKHTILALIAEKCHWIELDYLQFPFKINEKSYTTKKSFFQVFFSQHNTFAGEIGLCSVFWYILGLLTIHCVTISRRKVLLLVQSTISSIWKDKHSCGMLNCSLDISGKKG